MFEIGSSLREARTRQGLDFEEMEGRTKVRAKYLRYLEDERFDQLPGHTYTKGFLRVYADGLGLDGDLYVDEYNSRFVGVDDEVQPRLPRTRPASRSRRERRESRGVAVALVAIVLATALVIAAWRFGGADDPKVQGLAQVGATAQSGASATRKITVSIRAARGPSFVEVRSGPRLSKPLYLGTLQRGRTQTFTAASLYLAVAKPANVVVRLDGRRIRVDGEITLGAQASTAP